MTRPLRIYLEDHGQDLLCFTLRHGVIEDSNLQGMFWHGKKVLNDPATLKPGDTILFPDGRTLKYPVQTVSIAEDT